MGPVSGVFQFMGVILVNYYGWVFFVALLIWLTYQIRKLSNIEKYASSIKWITLEVKIDELNERSPFAMEQFFTALHATHSTITWGEALAGKIQLYVSCEIVSLGGRVSYMFHLPDRYRTLLESAIFSQYPRAEIYEVEDYLKNLPKEYEPDEADFDFWGTQLNKAKGGVNSVYPIRTFPGFEHKEQETFIDPLATLLEAMSNIEPYELMASQIVIKPVQEEWKKPADAILAKLRGTPVKHAPPGILHSLITVPVNALLDAFFGLFGLPGAGGGHEEKKKDEVPSKIQYLSEGEKQILAAVEHSIPKVSYEAHIRLLYLTPKGRLNKSLRIPEMIGAYRAFSDPLINGLKPDTGHTWTDATFKVSQKLEQPILRKRILTRKRHFLVNFKNRDAWKGSGHFYLNSEELASLYHFPVAPNVRVSQLERVQTIKSAPPSNLPVG